jgi:hypothetical protein
MEVLLETTSGIDITRWGKVKAWWLIHPDVDADHFSVLAALSTYADEEGYCQPSQATLARWLKRSRPWVNRVIAELVEGGLLEKTARSRANGGTTSCRYRLPSRPPVTAATPGVVVDDTPCHADDTTQADAEQIQTHALCAEAHANADARNSSKEHKGTVPADWQPTEAVMGKALALYPSANLAEHTALFVARCRGKGYTICPGGADDLWLAWLIEDMRARPRPTHLDVSQRSQGPPRSSRLDNARFSRFAAWGLAASTPSAIR